MDAIEAMRTIGSCRRHKPDDVPGEVLQRAVEAARFAPQEGAGSRPGWWSYGAARSEDSCATSI